MFTNNLLDIFITFPVTNCESGQQGSEEKLKLSFSQMSTFIVKITNCINIPTNYLVYTQTFN